jgi:aldehyde dehydrogenase (NAD+)/coniferyl-aldehyde dehydrogenase
MSAVPKTQTPDALAEAFDALKAAQRLDPYPDWRTRKLWLKSLLNAVIDRREEYARAVAADFGHRSWHESMMLEVWPVTDALRYNIKNLRKWMKPRRVGVPWLFLPASARERPQPKGVVGIMAPWNYPLQLSIGPMAGALAAGNRVALKPAEATPRVAEFLVSLIEGALPADVVRVVPGEVELAQQFASTPWDHLLFTGAPSVGKLVLAAAAPNLTPVTLELGGKSPCIVAPGQDLDYVASRIVAAKLFNSGQTCIAADTVLVHSSERAALVEAITKRISSTYPSLVDNPDYSSLINDRARARLEEVLDDARERGATLIEVNPANEDFSDTPKRVPTLVCDCPADARIAEEEIFGPALLIVDYARFDDAIAWVNDRERPLVIYLFDDDRARIDRVTHHTHSGGLVINEVLMHAGCPDLPFGGIGNSGMGAYYGVHGFRTFSHLKGEFYQTRVNGTELLFPPFRKLATLVLPQFIGTPE